MSDAGAPVLPAATLARWSTLDFDAALAEARTVAPAPLETAAALVAAALPRAEQTPDASARWLDLADALVSAEDAGSPLRAELAYARARVLAQTGRLDQAEAALRQAQTAWRDAGRTAAAARANLGLTQILAMQGRLDEAETAARAAVTGLEQDRDEQEGGEQDGEGDAASVPLLAARAWRNLGTVQTLRERHARALESFGHARHRLARMPAAPEQQTELAHTLLNEASAFTFLDAVDPAEASLRAAIDLFAAAADSVNQGRTRTNLGRLLVRTGRLAPALAEFEAAARDLLGSELVVETADADALRMADELLLEWALGYLALNLHPEAARLLDKAEQLFRQAGQPFELAQTLYTRAALARAQGEVDAAGAAAAAALALWVQLDNPYWYNRTRLLQAQLALATGDPAAALADVSAMPVPDDDDDAAAPTAWDTALRVQVTLVQVDAHLALDDVDGAAASLAQAAAIGALDALPPDLAVQVAYARGRVARAQGDDVGARAAFQDAVARLERQRATLTLEQMRAAYLLDKDALFSDLILSLLAQPAPSTATLGAVFDTIERLRSRVLLEQLLAVTDAAEDGTRDAPAAQGDDAALRDELRRRLNWLYNRLLGEEGSRHPFVELSRELQRTEAQLARLELRRAPALPLAEPLPLADLQRRMPAGQVAVIYYVAADEVMALVVTADDAVLQRNLTCVAALQDAVDEFHFQLGRMEVRGGSEARLRRMAVEMRAVLGRLHTLLVAPFADRLDGRAVTWIPFGLLHQVPFHALWQGDGYLLERVTCTYAPSATLAARGWQGAAHGPLRTVAALAVDDPSIPAARLEAETVARAAPDAHLFVADEAGAAGLRRAAAAADVLHIATHGLFRRDNPFFSALKLADGWIDVHELYRLPLAARLVVLSACESGAARPTGGDELIGLARGFLAAGAHTLVVSRWNVHDAMGAALMTQFHAHLRREDAAARAASTTDVAAAALRAAQIEAIRAGAHPYFWAPFQVIG